MGTTGNDCTDLDKDGSANHVLNSGPPQKKDAKLYIETPLQFSFPMSRHARFQVFLKLENLQPPGSFKIRGISNMIQKAVKNGKCEHTYCASGGNAGLAAAFASQQLGIPCTVVIPSTTPQFVADNLRLLGAEVKVHGTVYDTAKELAQELGRQPGSLYVPAFEHPDVWEGHASLIVEAAQQMELKPDVVVTCVGGGGLLNGIVQGQRQVGWDDVPIVALETLGANCFNAAIEANEVVSIPDITSVAKCLGALSVAPMTLEYYKQAKPPIINRVVTDKEAVHACLKFAEDHRFLVEPACGATLAAVYSDVICQLIDSGDLKNVSKALVIVCGGAMVSTSVLEAWKIQFGL